MHKIAWMQALIPHSAFAEIQGLEAEMRHRPIVNHPIYFLDETESKEDRDDLRRRYPAYAVQPFARRLDYDGVICLVTNDCVTEEGCFTRGAVLILHWDGLPGSGVDEQYASVEAWAEATRIDVEERRAEKNEGNIGPA